MSLLAVTGGTGFVGGRVIDLALEAGHAVRALARAPQRPRAGVEWVPGSLADAAGLAALCAGADAVIHVAGAVNAPDRAAFAEANVAGTRAMLGAAEAAGAGRFVHVSSLAAREPALSDYGWSKREAEAAVAASPLAWSMVRPPAVYGPGDREMLELFRMAARGLLLLPPSGRLSLIHVDDLARLLLALAATDAPAVYEPDDGRVGGWTHRAFAVELGRAVGRGGVALAMPGWAIRAGAATDTLISRLRGRQPRLSFDRARYFCHPDWVVTHGAAPPAGLWLPRIPTPEGLAATAAAYREKGWLR